MVVNDSAYLLAKRGALESIASRLAPTISLTELHCSRWSLRRTRIYWLNAALLSPSRAGSLLQFP